MIISVREKRFLIVGGGFIALAAIIYLGGMILPSREGIVREVENKKALLARQRDMVSREDFYRTRIEQYRQRFEKDKVRLLTGENTSIAGAELQRVVKAMADQNGIEVLRRDIQREQNMQDGLVKVSVRIETKCEPDQLVRLLAAINNYERQLIVDEVAITSYRIQKKWEIRPILTVAGYIASPEAQQAAKPAAGK